MNEKLVLDIGPDLIELPEEIVKDIRTDQKNMYRIVKMIMTVELDVLKHVFSPVNHINSLQEIQNLGVQAKEADY